MFVVSLSSKKFKKVLLVIGAFVGIFAAVFSIGFFNTKSSDEICAKGSCEFSLDASTPEERQAFVEQFGWVVEKTPVEVREVVIPKKFDDVYEKYNSIQVNQGLDLRRYAGVRVKRWTYTIKNYPDYPENADYIRINMLVFEGKVIGGDVCSVRLDGFMHGFEKE